jgi:hypothetical protein
LGSAKPEPFCCTNVEVGRYCCIARTWPGATPENLEVSLVRTSDDRSVRSYHWIGR